MATADSRHGRRLDRPCLAPLGMADFPCSATPIGHKGNTGFRGKEACHWVCAPRGRREWRFGSLGSLDARECMRHRPGGSKAYAFHNCAPFFGNFIGGTSKRFIGKTRLQRIEHVALVPLDLEQIIAGMGREEFQQRTLSEDGVAGKKPEGRIPSKALCGARWLPAKSTSTTSS